MLHLLLFEIVSSLKVNVEKSELPIGIVKEHMDVLASMCGCYCHPPTLVCCWLLFFFLLVPVALRSSNGIFLEKATFFEEPTTFEGGRLTLLKIVLSSLPVYFMSSLVMPVLK